MKGYFPLITLGLLGFSVISPWSVMPSRSKVWIQIRPDILLGTDLGQNCFAKLRGRQNKSAVTSRQELMSTKFNL